MPPADRHVALLRSINVGGTGLIPMRDLAAAFERAGCREVRTHIQSGNVVYAAPAAVAKRVPAAVGAALKTRFGYDKAIVTRTAAELRSVARGNPFLKAAAEPASLHVAFLSVRPAPAKAAALDPQRSPGDQFAVRGREIYLCLPNGTARSKLTNAWFDSALGVTSTFRNWNTVLKLLHMAGG